MHNADNVFNPRAHANYAHALESSFCHVYIILVNFKNRLSFLVAPFNFVFF